MSRNPKNRGGFYEGNKVRGHGTWDNDRPPVAGVAGGESGQVRLEVIRHADRRTLEDFVQRTTTEGTQVYTDEWAAYHHLPERGRPLAQVCHTPGRREWARDDDGDGIRGNTSAVCNWRIG